MALILYGKDIFGSERYFCFLCNIVKTKELFLGVLACFGSKKLQRGALCAVFFFKI